MDKAPDYRPLTGQQLRFCEEYLKDHNATRAALRAGYSANHVKKNATHLLAKPHVQHYIKQQMEEQARKNGVNRQRIKLSLLRIAEAAESEGKYNSAIRAYELLGKTLGMFNEVVEHNVHEYKSASEIDKRLNELIQKTKTEIPLELEGRVSSDTKH